MSTWVSVKTRCSRYECDTNEMVSICSPPENHHHSLTRVIFTFTGPIYFLKWPKVYFFRAEDNLLTEVPYDFSLLLQKLVKPLSHMYASSRKVHTSTDVIVLYVGALYYSSIRNRNIIYKYFLTELNICFPRYDKNVITLGHNPWTCLCNSEITNMVSMAVPFVCQNNQSSFGKNIFLITL